MDKPRRPRLSLDLLKGFEAAARHLSFTRAAQELSVTQSAVSREIKTLEEQLGQPLFSRINRGLRLTDAGQKLYGAVGEALKLIEEATDQVAGTAGGRMLTVTTTVPLASLWLVPRLPQFTAKHPGVDVRIAASNENLDLLRGRIDLAIRWFYFGSAPPRAPLLLAVRALPVCAPALLHDRTRPLGSVADLAQHVLLDFEPDRPVAWHEWTRWQQAMRIEDLRPASTLRFSHYDQVIEAAIKGAGVALGHTPHVTRFLRAGLLIAPFGRDATVDLGAYHVLVAPRSAERLVAKDFVAWLHDEVRRDAELDGQSESSARRSSSDERPQAAGGTSPA